MNTAKVDPPTGKKKEPSQIEKTPVSLEVQDLEVQAVQEIKVEVREDGCQFGDCKKISIGICLYPRFFFS